MNVGYVLNRAQHWVASSPRATRAAALLRNQCNLAIGYHLAATADPRMNGEFRLLDAIAPETSFFVDVGANVGDWTAGMLERAPAARGLLFEPAPTALARLTSRFGGKPVEIVPAAAGDRVDEVTFWAEPEAGETSSVVAQRIDTSASITVQMTTLDRELAERKVEFVDLLKVDAEGFDYFVLRGAGEYFRNGRIGVVQFEYNGPWAVAGATYAGARAFLEGCGYEVYRLANDGLRPFDYSRFGEFFAYSNFVAVSPGSKPGLREMLPGS